MGEYFCEKKLTSGAVEFENRQLQSRRCEFFFSYCAGDGEKHGSFTQTSLLYLHHLPEMRLST